MGKPKGEGSRDRIQVDLTGTDIKQRIQALMDNDPVYRGRSMVAVIRMLLTEALDAGQGEPVVVDAEVVFLKRLERRQWLSEGEIVDVAAELEVEPDLLIKLQSCIKEGSKNRANGSRTS